MRMASALFAAFWLGFAPVVSGAIWTLAAVLRFGVPAQRLRRVLTFAFVSGVALVAAVVLKVFQSVLLLGSLGATFGDYRSILVFRSGAALQYSAARHLKDSLVSAGYLFLLAIVVLAVLLWRERSFVVREGFFLSALIAGGLAWQVVMPGHAAFHSYMLREMMVPMACLAAVLSSPLHWTGQRRALERCALANIILVATVLVLPLVITGEPLWRVRLATGN